MSFRETDRLAAAAGATSGDIRFIARGAGIVLLGTIIGSGLKVLFEMLAARRLGPGLFGVLFLGLAVFGILEKLGALELPSAMLRFVGLYRGADDTARIKGTFLGGLRLALPAAGTVAALLFVFSGSLAGRTPHAGELAFVLKVLAAGLIFTTATEMIVSTLQALGAVEYRVWVRLVFEPGLSVVLAIYLFHRGLTLGGALGAYVAPLVLGSFMAVGFLRRAFPPFGRRDIPPVADSRGLLRFSLPLYAASLLSVCLAQANPLMLGVLRPPADVGVFGAAQRTALVLPLILDSFNAVFAPVIADLAHRRAFDRLAGLFQVVTKWVLALSLPAFLLLVRYGSAILGLWGKGYESGTACLVIIAAGQLVNCATGPVGCMILMSGRPKLSLANTSGALALNLVLNIFLIPRYGVIGSAAAFSLSLAAVNVARLIEVGRLLKMQPYRRDSLKPPAAVLIAYLILVLAESSLLPAAPALRAAVRGGVILALSYVLLLLIMGIGTEEKVVLNTLRKRIGGRAE